MFTRESPRCRASSYGNRGETREGSRIMIVTSYLGIMILYIMIRDNPCVTTILQACDSFSNGMRVSATYFTCTYSLYDVFRDALYAPVLQILTSSLVCQSNPHRLQFITPNVLSVQKTRTRIFTQVLGLDICSCVYCIGIVREHRNSREFPDDYNRINRKQQHRVHAHTRVCQALGAQYCIPSSWGDPSEC